MPKSLKFHDKALKVISNFSESTKRELSEIIQGLQTGVSYSLPVSRPMPTVYPGVHELRFRDSDGLQRVFYYTKCTNSILIFHAFIKKTQKTPTHEINLAYKRLMEMLSYEK